MTDRRALIIGAGPAGLTAAYELVTRTDYKPIILELSGEIGGLARTVDFGGNRIDIGPHRFFSKSDRIMDWWMDMLPLEAIDEPSATISYRNKKRDIPGTAAGPDPDKTDSVMLLRRRRTRIYFLRKLFEYPISFSGDTLGKLGLGRTIKIVFSYLRSAVFPIKDEKTLEDFFINRFGRELYRTFFKSYTEKVWGKRCDQISAEWGAQRVKGLSITKALVSFLKDKFGSKRAQKDKETSLIDQFLYPKLGAGQMWEEVARKVVDRGGEVVHYARVDKLIVHDGRIVAVEVVSTKDGARTRYDGDLVFSTMPIKELICAIDAPVPADVQRVSSGLPYRDMLVVALLLDKLALTDGQSQGRIPDNWIYLQDNDLVAGRMQICNNMSPYLVKDPSTVLIGLEYFCDEGDDVWKKTDDQMVELAIAELSNAGIVERSACKEGHVLRILKSYPAYFGTYTEFDRIRDYVDSFPNLYLIGRNGMHKYNNQDHSMMTAMVAVDNIVAGRADKSNIWDINTELEYHEEKKEASASTAG